MKNYIEDNLQNINTRFECSFLLLRISSIYNLKNRKFKIFKLIEWNDW